MILRTTTTVLLYVYQQGEAQHWACGYVRCFSSPTISSSPATLGRVKCQKHLYPPMGAHTAPPPLPGSPTTTRPRAHHLHRTTIPYPLLLGSFPPKPPAPRSIMRCDADPPPPALQKREAHPMPSTWHPYPTPPPILPRYETPIATTLPWSRVENR